MSTGMYDNPAAAWVCESSTYTDGGNSGASDDHQYRGVAQVVYGDGASHAA